MPILWKFFKQLLKLVKKKLP